eukprot:788934-Pyramimonas_sp.AAC.1
MGVQVQYDPSFQVSRNSEDFAAAELSVLDTSQIKFVDGLIAPAIVDDFDARSHLVPRLPEDSGDVERCGEGQQETSATDCKTAD